MQKIAEVKERIRTVEGIRDVCSTLAIVAAARLSKTRERALGARIYASTLRAMIARQQRAALLAGLDPATLSPFLACREPVRRVLLFVIGPDRGLCGGYSLALGRSVGRYFAGWQHAGVEVDLVVRGRRLAAYLRRQAGVPIAEQSGWTRAGVTDDEVSAMLERAVGPFLDGTVDEVWAAYTSFLSTVAREPVRVRLLPIVAEKDSADAVVDRRWFYEPAREPCVEALLSAFVRTQIEAVLLEAYASEQAARMVTMQEATERADRSLAELRVRHNRLRREAITFDLVGALVAGRLRGGAEHGAA